MPHSRACPLTCSVLFALSSFSLVILPWNVWAQAEQAAPKKAAPAPRKPAAGVSAPAKPNPPASKPDAAAADEAVADETNREEEKERIAAERFLSVLEKNPRRGTALDRVYGYHVERGSLDQWLQQYRDRTTKDAKDGAAWLLIGLIEAHRGQDAAAVTAFKQAEQQLPENALVSFYLGQALVLVEQPAAAAEAMERAINRKPAAADLLDVFQALGRVYQRTRQSDKALDVWNRLEKLFPNDLRVQEQIAQTLIDEDQAELALPRFEALAAKTTKDLYRRSQFQIQAAEIKVRLGKTQEALADFEKLLGELNPENWMYRDVRHKIDNVFLRTEDQAGLATYYTGWLAKHPDDIDAIVRLARVLATQERSAESRDWLEKGLKLAPSRKDLRQTIIDQLVYDHNFAAAIKHYELLDQQEPNNPDTIREWGRLILRDFKRPETERRTAAAAIWKRLVDAKSNDPLVVSQVADLFRHAGLKDDAIALYQQAIKLAPDAPQYREYLGEYFHQLKRPEEALATWRKIVEAENRTAPNLARLAEVLIGFGYAKEGTDALVDAVSLQPKDLDLRMRLARAWNRADKYNDSLQQLVEAEKLVSNAEESEAVLTMQLQNYQSAEQLPVQIERMRQELAAAADTPQMAARWYLLARYLEANHQYTGALVAIQRARKLDSKSISILAIVARLEEANNKYQEAAAANRQLALIDRRFRSEYLTKVAKLEARQGRKTEALQAGRDLIASAPGNPESYEFFAQLCFQLGQNDEGLETLRRAVRVNPSDPKGVLNLASALANQLKTAEAIDLYWRAFDRSHELDDKLDVVARLTDLYLQSNHLDRLLDRLDRARRADGQQQRVMTLCLAQAHQSAGDYGTARTELERMLTADSRDTQLIQQLAKLAELEGDYFEAAKYQAQLLKLAPSREIEKQLARFLALSGENAQANELIVKLALEEKDPERLLKSVDELLDRQQFDQAIQVVERLLKKDPRNWEYAYRYGVALAANQPQQASEQFQRLLDLNLPEGSLGIYEQVRRKQQAGKPHSAGPLGQVVADDLRIARAQAISQLQRASKIASVQGRMVTTRAIQGAQQTGMWQPRDYREARIAVLSRLLESARQDGSKDKLLQSVASAWDKNKSSLRQGLDWLYVTQLDQNPAESVVVAKALLQLPDPSVEVQLAYLIALSSIAQNGEPAEEQLLGMGIGTEREAGNLSLSEDELNKVVQIYRQVAAHPEFDVIIGSGQGRSFPSMVMAQLRFAKRQPEAEQLMKEMVASVKSETAFLNLLSNAASAGRVEESLVLWEAMGTQTVPSLVGNYPLTVMRDAYLNQLISVRVNAGAMPDVIKILDRRISAPRIQHPKAPVTATGGAAGSSRNSTRFIRQAIINPSGQRVITTTPIIDGQIDRYATTLLQAVWTHYQAVGQTNELLTHVSNAATNKDTPEATRVPWQVALFFLQCCNDQSEVALGQLFELSRSRPDDLDLKFLLAQLYSMRGKASAALNVLEGVQTTDQDLIQVRDYLILEAAFAARSMDRARQAAEALSGQSLDAGVRQQVLSYMQQLGMAMPGAVANASRTPRQPARSQLGPLIAQLIKLKKDGNTDQALQVATSILQKTQSGRNPANPNAQNRKVNQVQNEELDQGRKLAIQVLKESGKLQEIIERIEQQLKNSPNSIQLHAKLAEYYAAAGEKEKAKEMSYRLVELNQVDPVPRWMMGLQLVGGPDFDRGMSMLKSALKQQPQLLGRGPASEVLDTFQRAKKLRELARLLDDIDLAAVGSSEFAVQFISRLIDQDRSTQFALPILKRAWAAYPPDRAQILTRIHDQFTDRTPEVYAFAKQLIFPESELSTTYPNWADLTRNASEGMVSGSLDNLLRIAQAQDQLAVLERELTTTLQQHPNWQGGHITQAVLSIRQQRYEQPMKYFQELIDSQGANLSYTAAWLIGQELATVPNGSELAVRYYERAADNPANANRAFAMTPEFSLIRLYEKAGQKEQARDALVRAGARNLGLGINSQIDADRVVQNRYEIANALQRLGFALDAVTLYNGLLQDTRTLQLAQAYGAQYSKEARLRLDSIFQNLTPADLGTALKAMLQPTSAKQLAQEASALDLLLSIEAVPQAAPRMTSSLIKVLKETIADEKVRNDISASLEKLIASRPQDVSLQVVSGLLSVYDPRPEVQLKGVEQVDQWVTSHVANTKPTGQATGGVHDQAAGYLALWLVARECLGKQPLAEAGNRIATTALQAGRSQPAKFYLQVMLRESGHLAWDAGDKATAEARWTELLELVIKPVDPRLSARDPALYNPRVYSSAVIGQVPRPATAQATITLQPPAQPTVTLAPAAQVVPRRTLPGMASASVGVTYTTQPFVQMSPPIDQCFEIANLAASKELHALSFKAVRSALQFLPSEVTPTGRTVTTMQPSGTRVIAAESTANNGIAARQLVTADAIAGVYSQWVEHHAPAEEIYGVLLDVVVPPQRTGLVQVLPLSPKTRLSVDADDVGHLLIRQAIAVKKVDKLREKLTDRTQSTVGEYLARLLLVRLDLEMVDISDAKIQLAALSKVVERRGLVFPTELYGPVALPALEHDELALAAQPLLLQVAKGLMSGTRGSYVDRHSRIYLRLAKLQFDRGELQAGTQLLDQYLKDHDDFYKSSGGKFERSIRQRSVLQVVRALAEAGQIDATLKRLGEAADMWQYDGTGSVQDISNTVIALGAIRSLPAPERFRLLKAWTLPVEDKGTLRTLDVFQPDDQVPGELRTAGSASLPVRLQSGDGTVSSLVLLLQAAQEANKLDELLEAIHPLAERRVEHAGELRALIYIAQQKSDAAAALQTVILQARARLNAPVPPIEPPWSAYHLACAAMSDAALRPFGQQLCRILIDQNQQVRRPQMLSHLRYYLSTSLTQSSPPVQQAGGRDPGLRWWLPANEETAEQHAAGQVPAWWVAHAGLVSHICGPAKQALYFRYPLEGTFEFSVDVYSGEAAHGNVGFAGLIFDGARDGSGIDISPMGYSETFRLATTVPYANQNYNRMTVQVTPGRIRHFINQTLVYTDDDPGHGSPWLGLYVDRAQQTVYRNFQITGQPVIPRTVRLFDEDRLEGWVASFYQERQPPRRMNGRQSHEDAKVIVRRDANPLSYDWAAEQGILHARKVLASPDERQPQSRLYYHRPLEAGDELTYEFYYEPGITLVHPALDRMALLLDPQGVRVHWITDSNLDDKTGLAPGNVSDHPENRRGPATLPLQPKQWNTLRIQVQDSTAKIELNNQLIYETPLDANNSRQFGFYHDRTQTGGQVRNVMLTGKWPEQLSPEILNDLNAPRPNQSLTSADRHARHAIIGDTFYQLAMHDVLQQAAKLAPAERYAYLRDWVLPSDDGPVYRLIGGFTPVNPPPFVTASAEGSADPAAKPSTDRTPQVSGGELVSPVYELMAVAKELQRIPELQQYVDKLPADSPAAQQARLAVSILIGMSQEQWQPADMQQTLLLGMQQQLPVTAQLDERWPAVLVAWKGLRNPATRASAKLLLDHAAEQAPHTVPADRWSLITRHLQQQANWLTDQADVAPARAPSLGLRQWTPSTWANAERRGSGIPPTGWRFKEGELFHLPGGTEDWLYFQSPLRGSFDVTCEISSGERQDLQLHYGARYVGIASNLKEVDFGRISGLMVSPQVGQPIRSEGKYFAYKLVVRDGTVEVFVDGYKILDRYQSTLFDSWLGIHAPTHSAGSIRNLQITGTPTIPTELDLLANDRVEDAWRGDYYSDHVVRWREERGVLRSPRLVQTRTPQQTLLQYHRPLAEDGELEYEYFYDPNIANVHPAFDRMVLMIDPAGVDLHWITDLQHDRSGLSPDNMTTEPQHRRGPEKLPLKPQDWNHVKLKLVGDTVTLMLNGVEVYVRPLDPQNQRTFGLFHYAQETEARVRNIRHRGNWPQTLPTIADQELSGTKK